jgi:hypothetical protein
MCLAEKQQIPILVFSLTWPGFEHKIYRIQGDYMLTITPLMQFKCSTSTQDLQYQSAWSVNNILTNQQERNIRRILFPLNFLKQILCYFSLAQTNSY